MDRTTYLLHQVHLAKLATDISADVVSTWLMWQRRPRAALLLAHAAAALASATVVTRCDLSPLQTTCRPLPRPCATSARSLPGMRPTATVRLASHWDTSSLPPAGRTDCYRECE
jgi:hypothetical protein